MLKLGKNYIFINGTLYRRMPPKSMYKLTTSTGKRKSITHKTLLEMEAKQNAKGNDLQNRQ